MSSNPLLFLSNLNGSLAFWDKSGGGTLTGSGAVRYQAAQGARINLAKNPRLANDSTGWGAAGGSASLTRITNDGSRGFSTSAEITASVVNEGANVISRIPLGAAQIRAKVAHTVSLDAWIMSGATDWRIRFIESDMAGNALVTSSGSVFAFDGNKTRYSLTYTPTQTGCAVLQVQVLRATAVAGTVRVSCVVEEEGTIATPSYFDGTTGAWLDPITGILGTAHASPSVSQAAAWVEEGTTNACVNPSFEVDTSGWANLASGVLTRDTTFARLGGASGKVVCPGGGGNHGVSLSSLPAAVSGQTWTFTPCLRSSAAVGATIVIYELSAASAILQTTSQAITLPGDSWAPFSVTRTLTDASCAKIRCDIYTANVVNIWVDTVNIEQKAYSTSYCDGSLGTGYAWTGTANASTSTRTGTTLRALPDNRVNTVSGAVAARFNRLGSVTGSPRVWENGSFGTANGDHLNLGLTSPYTTLIMTGYTNATAGNATKSLSVAQNSWETVFGRWSAIDFGVSTAGLPSEAVGARTVTPLGVSEPTDNNMRFGGSNGVQYSNGLIGPVAIFSRPLTTKERTKLNATPVWTKTLLRRHSRRENPYSLLNLVA